MHSSISSSSQRIPPSVRPWHGLAAAGMFVALLLGAEYILRLGGLWPSVADSTLLWAMHRNQARGDEVLVVLGSSRSLLGVDPAVLRDAFPGHQVLHLGIDGTGPYAVLNDLASDHRFRGIILCEATAEFAMPDQWKRSQPWVDFYAEDFPHWGTLQLRLDESIRVFVQSHLVVASPAMNTTSLVREGPYRSHTHMRADRFRPTHYRSRLSYEDQERARQHVVGRLQDRLNEGIEPLDRARFEASLVGELASIGQRLRENGATLVLVHLPITGESLEFAEKWVPKEEYWDRIQPITGISAIHFMDHPELAKFDAPDTSHLDAEDAPRFTAALADILVEFLAHTSM